MAGPVHRIKARFGDGRMQTFKRRDGESMENERREIAACWKDDNGRINVRFEDDIQAVIIKALGGGKDGIKVFFDLFDTEPRGGTKPATNRKAPPPSDDEDY